MRRGWVAALLAATLLAPGVAGCGLDPARVRWERALHGADRRADHGDWEAAAAQYGALAPDAPTPEYERYIAWRLAWMEEQRGDYGAALAAYEQLWSGGVRDDYAGRALFHTGDVLYRRLERQEEGLAVWERTLSALPDSTGALRALSAIEEHHREAGALQELVALLEERYGVLKGSAIGDNLLLLRARVLWELGAGEEAVSTYRMVLEVHGASGLADDARWGLAEALRGLGRYEEALVQLRFITEDQDSSWYVGDYNSSYVDDARFYRGLIYLEALGSWKAAVEEFTLFYEEFEESLLRDDARWNIVQAWLGAGEGARAAAACEALEEAEPESRWVDDCARLREALAAGQPPEGLRTRAAELWEEGR